MNQQESTLDRRTKYGFAFGHILNDMASPIWFTYSLLFYKMFFPSRAYWFVVTGQVFDALVTICIGMFFDGEFTKGWLFRLGKYKTWYYIGLILLLLALPACFSEIPLIVHSQTGAISLFLLVICFAQIGWSFCQISHLSMINELSITTADRIFLTSSRQAASIYAAIIVFATFWYTLEVSDGTRLVKNDIFIISNDTFYITVLGLGHSIVFLFAIQEKKLVNKKEQLLQVIQTPSNVQDAGGLTVNKADGQRPMDNYERMDWFHDATFYKISFIYMFARLFMNIPLTYIVLYLPETLFMPKSSIALVPLLIYISGFVFSFVSNFIENQLGTKHDLLLGIIFGVIASLWTLFGTCDNEEFKRWQIYVVVILLGISLSMVKISTVSLVASMIGNNKKSTSFVYGTVSCFEKVLGGFTIGLLEQFGPSTSVFHSSSASSNMTANVTSVVSSVNWQVCPNGQRSNLFYYYILTYGNSFILAFLLLGLISISSLEMK